MRECETDKCADRESARKTKRDEERARSRWREANATERVCEHKRKNKLVEENEQAK